MYSVNIQIDQMAKYCVGCGEEIHPMRVKILPNTKTCVDCSTTGAKRGIPVLHGNVEKDDTWVDMVFMEEEEYQNYEIQTGRLSKNAKKASKAEMQNYDEDDNIITPSFNEEE